MAPVRRSPVLLITAVVLALIGLALGGGGIWLMVLGGSWYYLIAGIGFLVTAWLLATARPSALWIYALVVIGTLAWAVWEVGLDWWALAPRGDLVILIGVVLLLPWIAGRLVGDATVMVDGRLRPDPAIDRGRIVLGVCVGISVIVAVVSWFTDPHEIEGTLEASAAPGTPQPAAGNGEVPPGEWHAYGRTGFGQTFSPLDQITPANVDSLEVAWTYHTNDISEPGDPVETTFEVTPLKVGNRLFFCTPHQNVVALDADTGAEIWRVDPKIEGELALQHLTCRGLAYQPPSALAAGAPAGEAAAPAVQQPAPPAVQQPAADQPEPAPSPVAPDLPQVAAGLPETGRCDARLFMPTADGRLLALNPEDGSVCSEFGDDGQVDLWSNMPNVNPGAYYSTSPVVVTRDLVIVGGTVLDNVSTHEASGVIRAYDLASGRLVWNWDSGNPDQTAPLPPGQTYTPNSPNSWSISSVDETLGMIYVPLGNQPPDQWGGNRSEAVERFSSAVVALDLATGKVRWVFQTVHHDLWDYDVPSQPSLVDLPVGGETVPALVQPTKQGEIFVLDRRTGEPILPVDEVPAPQGAAAGDHTAATQPMSALSFSPPPLTGRDMWGISPFDQLACRIRLKRLRYEGRFTPPTTGGTLVYPGNFGVFNWGGVAVDPTRGVMFGTPAYLAFVSTLVPRENDTELYVQGGSPPKGSLPALNENFGAPFAVKLGPFLSSLGLPCQRPPWGYAAVGDLTTGRIVWMHRNGTVRDLSPVPLPFRMGVPDLGGPVATASGLAFISGTLDYYVRAFDVATGEQLWEDRLPAGGQATPMTYLGSDGRQYLLVVAGGHGSLGTKRGDAVIAYALPRQG